MQVDKYSSLSPEEYAMLILFIKRVIIFAFMFIALIISGTMKNKLLSSIPIIIIIPIASDVLIIQKLTSSPLKNFSRMLLLIYFILAIIYFNDIISRRNAIIKLKNCTDVDYRINIIYNLNGKKWLDNMDLINSYNYLLFYAFLEKEEYEICGGYLENLKIKFSQEETVYESLATYLFKEEKFIEKMMSNGFNARKFYNSDGGDPRADIVTILGYYRYHKVYSKLSEQLTNYANLYAAESMFYIMTDSLNKAKVILQKFEELIVKFSQIYIIDHQELSMIFDIRYTQLYIMEENYRFAHYRIQKIKFDKELSKKFELELLTFEAVFDSINSDNSGTIKKLDYVIAMSKNMMTINYAKKIKSSIYTA